VDKKILTESPRVLNRVLKEPAILKEPLKGPD